MSEHQDTRIETCSNCPGRATVGSEPEPGTSQSRTPRDTFRSLASKDDVFSLLVFLLWSFMNIHGSINSRVVSGPDSQHVPVPCLDRSISTSPQPHFISSLPFLFLVLFLVLFLSLLSLPSLLSSSASSLAHPFRLHLTFLFFCFLLLFPIYPPTIPVPTAVRLPLHSSRTSLLYSCPP